MVNNSPELALKLAEKSALERKQSEKEASELENNPEESDTFSYSPTSTSSTKSSSFFSGKLSGKKKKFGPLIIFAIVLLVFLVVSFGTTSLLPGHIDANTQEAFDVQHAIMKIAKKTIVKSMLATGSIPSSLADRLTESGLEVGYLNKNGTFIAGLRPSSDSVISLASSTDASSEAEKDNSLVLNFKDQIITAESFSAFFEGDPEVYAAFDEATYGRASNHFDTAANNFYATNLKTTRNVFKNYKATGNNSTDTEAFNTAFSALFGKSNSSANTVMDVTYIMKSPLKNSTFDEEKQIGCWENVTNRVGEAGKPGECYKCIAEDVLGNCINWELKEKHEDIDTEEKACIKKYRDLHENTTTVYENGRCYANVLSSNASNSAGSSYLSDLEKMAYSETSAADAEIKAAAVLNQAINANETYESINYYLTIEEAISKMKAGKGSESPINSILNMLTMDVTSTDDAGNTTTGSALESPILASVLTKNYNGSKISSHGNISSVDRIINDASSSIAKFYGTDQVAAAHAGSFVTTNTKVDALNYSGSSDKSGSSSIISDFGSFYVGKIEQIKEQAASGIIASINPSISRTLFGNVSEYAGIKAGDFFAEGGSALGGKIASYAAGGTTGTHSSIAAYQKESSHILALDAAADRVTRSPFDISSPNTFLGSIAHNLTSIAATNSTFSSVLSSLSTMTNLGTRVFATSAEDEFQTISGQDCIGLNSYGAEGNAWCIPTITFDASTIESALESDAFDDFLHQNLNEDNSVKSNSDLDLFLTYNNGRASNFGSKNANIYNALASNDSLEGSIANEASSYSEKQGFFARIFDKVKDFFKSAMSKIKSTFSNFVNKGRNSSIDTFLPETNLSNRTYIDRVNRISTGEEFNNGSEYWDAYKYAQAYTIYNRVLDQVDYFEETNTNPVALSQYFTPASGSDPTATYIASVTAVPDDETDVEYLARISGLTLEDSALALNYYTYTTYLASLDRSTLYDFTSTTFDTTLSIINTMKQFFYNNNKNSDLIDNKKSARSYIARRETYYV